MAQDKPEPGPCDIYGCPAPREYSILFRDGYTAFVCDAHYDEINRITGQEMQKTSPHRRWNLIDDPIAAELLAVHLAPPEDDPLVLDE